jgi:hypothetical protein
MKYYKASLSNKESFILDEQDYTKLVAGMNSGSFVKLKQAIINPSFLVMILPVSEESVMKDILPEREVDGFIDEKDGVYKITKDIKPAIAKLVDKFSV